MNIFTDKDCNGFILVVICMDMEYIINNIQSNSAPVG